MREEGVSVEDIKTCFLGKVSQAKGPGRAQAQLKLSFWIFTLRERPLEGGEKSSDVTEVFMRTIPAAVSQAVGGKARRREPRSGGKCSGQCKGEIQGLSNAVRLS